jgi:ParB family transcriptional regulator, chromosome partitioning protein
MSKPPEAPRKVLGRGLNSLLPSRPPAIHAAVAEPAPAMPAVARLRLDQIDPNPLQPRRTFRAERLQELAQSIQSNGIIQPIVVRASGSRYQLVAGERRWRAAQIAGLDVIPAVVEQISDDRLLEVTLIENIQREDLNPIETAIAFERLATDLGISHEEIGRRTGKDRSTITNFLRLLQLPPDIQQLVADGRIRQGHARCLLGLPTEMQRQVAEKIITQDMSVRQVERLTQRMSEVSQTRAPKTVHPVDPNVRAAIEEMERVLGTKVRITTKSAESGWIEIEFYSAEDLDRLYTTIVGHASAAS